jgi:dienelactone hydrolase
MKTDRWAGWAAACLLLGAVLPAAGQEVKPQAPAPAPATTAAAAAAPGDPALKGELIFLRDFGSDDTGYLAIPQQQPRAGVVVAHGITGLSRTFRRSCDELAGQGYLVLAVDFFNGRIPSSTEEARRIWGSLDQKLVTAALKTARAFYTSSPRFKMDKVVLVGVGESVPAVAEFATADHGLAGVTLVAGDSADLPVVLDQLVCPGQVIVFADQAVPAQGTRLEMVGVNEIWTGMWPEQSVAGQVWNLSSQFWERQKAAPPPALAKKLLEKIF